MTIRASRLLLAAATTLFLAPSTPARCEEVLVAVASNFASVLGRLEKDFETSSGHDLRIVSGSTGKLYAQIVHGAPFEVFLAADERRPAKLISDGLAPAASRRTYATGRLVLWSRDRDFVANDGRETLRAAGFRRLALANPELAPYGKAARETLASLELETALADRIVMGENIGQTYALVSTQNAELGFIALSQLAQGARPTNASAGGSRWLVPSELHSPIRQDAVLVRNAGGRAGARAFLDYLSSPGAKDLIRSFGYEVE